ncbi:MAG TPA: hypothetical protein PK659_07400 [Methanothrix sp.]|nr:hypothetical protein [Methanothrix sp.]HOK58885.1 hypothetical protein [Methanothrix sp.]HOL44057.1 hypothetical protein [Methanothrix sp.]HPO89097.1 hypothetical protein [Methanothrix sp.]
MNSRWYMLAIALVLISSPAGAVVAGGFADLGNKLVVSGETVTLQAPEGDYIYAWSAVVDGRTIAQGEDRVFTFTAPTVTQEEGSKVVTVDLLIRTKVGGCVNQATGKITVYPMPVCGIGGPEEVTAEETATYRYTGGTDGKLTYEWSVDGTPAGANSDTLQVDWSNYVPGMHKVGLKITKDYSDVVPNERDPYRSVSCELSVNVKYTSGLAVTKTPSVNTARVGTEITYTYEITNTGTIRIKDIVLRDDRLGEIKPDKNMLKPGETATATAKYTVKETDLPGPLTNSVTASGTEMHTGNKVVSGTATASVTLEYTASITLDKSAEPNPAKVGDTVTYTYTITNSGEVTLGNLKLSDDKLGDISLTKTALAPGESITATKTYTVTENDLPGPIVNSANVSAKDVLGVDVSAEDSETVSLTYTASVSIEKTAAPSTANVGQTITYTYTIRNTGDVTLSEIKASDDKLGDISLTKTALAPRESITATKTYTVTQVDLPGPISNTASVSAKDVLGKDVSATARAFVDLGYRAALSVTKTPTPSPAGIGQTVTYEYVVTNTGDVTLSGVSLEDSELGRVDLNANTLAPGESATGTKMYTVTESNLPGPITNTATAYAKDVLNNPISASTTASLPISYTSSISLEQLPSKESVALGDSVTYTYTVKNTGSTTISGIQVTDERFGPITLDKQTLKPGESATGTHTYTATQEVIGEELSGKLSNSCEATGRSPVGETVTASATSSVEVRREALTPMVGCVNDNGDGTYTVTWGYSNPNRVAVKLTAGKKNMFRPGNPHQGQPEVFEPGMKENAFVTRFKEKKIEWVLDETSVTADSGATCPSICAIDGSDTLCTNKEETYTANVPVVKGEKYEYEWKLNGKTIGNGDEVTISGSGYKEGDVLELELRVTAHRKNPHTEEEVPLIQYCKKEINVIPEPVAEIKIQ